VKIFPLVRAEFARLTASRIGIASLIALMTVPLVYGGLYLWGNQDPYSSLDKVPAALVVQDIGTTVDGAATNYGRKAAQSLLKDQKFGWVEVTATKASAGVKNGTYDFGITFPASFSARLASTSGHTPRSAELRLTTDDTNSYLSTTIAKQAAEAVRVEVAKEVGAKASVTLLGAVGDLRNGLVQADNGATALADGAASAATGAASLGSGSVTLASGASTLESGLANLDAKASALPASATQLGSGASSVFNGAASASAGSATLAGKAGQVVTLAASIRSQVASELAAAGVDPAVASTVDTQLAGVSGATARISTGTSTLAASLGTLAAGAARVSAGASTLNSSAPALATAVHSASTGAASLASGAGALRAGASALQSGTAELATGSASLRSSLRDAVVAVPVTTAAGRTSTADLIADPLAVKQSAITKAANYGAGLAPFFLALASWIGIYALFLLVRPLSRRALTAVRRPIRTTLAGWLTPALLGVVQMVGLFALVTLALHLPVANPLGLVTFMAFVAITFAAIVLALNVLLGSVGQFLALVFMVVQLVTAGGTFPWQTLPGPLAALHQALPMSHAVDGIRQLMYGGLSASVWSSILPLALWLVGSLVVSVLGAMRQGRFRILRELRPSPIGA
jgi:putative membrane protein